MSLHLQTCFINRNAGIFQTVAIRIMILSLATTATVRILVSHYDQLPDDGLETVDDEPIARSAK